MTDELKPLEEIRGLVQEAYNILHACNREMLTREVRDDTKAVLYRALKIIDTRPSGVVLVPEEPTTIMIGHGICAVPVKKDEKCTPAEYVTGIYKAMLKALPTTGED